MTHFGSYFTMKYLVYWSKATVYMVKVKMSLLWWVPFLLKLWLDYSGSKRDAVKSLYYTVKWDMPFTWCNFYLCSPLLCPCSIQLSGQRATLLCWELLRFTAALQSRCPCAAAASRANAFVSHMLGSGASTLTKRPVVFLSTCFLGKKLSFSPL